MDVHLPASSVMIRFRDLTMMRLGLQQRMTWRVQRDELPCERRSCRYKDSLRLAERTAFDKLDQPPSAWTAASPKFRLYRQTTVGCQQKEGDGGKQRGS